MAYTNPFTGSSALRTARHAESIVGMSDGDALTGANELDQANRIGESLLALRRASLLQITGFGASAPYGAIEARYNVGTYLLFDASTYDYCSRMLDYDPPLLSPTAWPGAGSNPNSFVPGAHSTSSMFSVVAFRGYSYAVSAGTGLFAAGLALPDSMVDVGDMAVASKTGGDVALVCGLTAGSSAVAGWSNAPGTSWTAATGTPAGDSNWAGRGRFAVGGADGTSVILMPTDATSGVSAIWWSEDSGETYTKVVHGISGVKFFAGGGYDAALGRWLLADAQTDDLYASAAPGTPGSWSKLTDIGTQTVDFFVLRGGLYLSCGTGMIHASWDGGTSWESIRCPTPTFTRGRIVDGRLWMFGTVDTFCTGVVE
jgi:hypothetical protein